MVERNVNMDIGLNSNEYPSFDTAKRVGQTAAAALSTAAFAYMLRGCDAASGKTVVELWLPATAMATIIGGGMASDASMMVKDGITYVRARIPELKALYNKLRR